MVAPLTEHQRVKLASLADEGRGYGAAAREVRCSKSAARHYMTLWRGLHTVQPRKHKGRAPVLTAAQGDQALDLLLSRRFMGAPGVAHELHCLGVTAKVLSGDTVLKAAKAAAKRAGMRIYFWRGNPHEQLSKQHIEARLAFALKHQRTDWRRVVFSDRKKFVWQYPGCKVPHECWLQEGDFVEAPHLAGSRRGVNVYCALTPHGLTAMHLVSGTWGHKSPYVTRAGKPAKGINTPEYKDVLGQTLLPGAAALMKPSCGKVWVFQQDGDKAHGGAAGAIAEYNKSRHQRVQLLAPWPARSCDLNPIEHVWAYVQRKLTARGCRTWAEFKAAVGEELQCVPQSLIDSLYESMGRRMKAVIEVEGARTGY
jgi:hypothetical protein